MKKLFLAVYLLLFVSLNAEIIEIKNISELTRHINKSAKTLFLYDIDNTILEPTNPYNGSDQWFSAVLKRDMDSGYTGSEAFIRQFPVFLSLIKKAKFQKVEDNSLEVINSLKDLNNFKTLALTARSEPLIDDTFNLLKENNALSTLSNLAESRVVLVDTNPNSKAFYNKGTVHCANNSKGLCLKKFIEMFAEQESELKNIEEIILIDDKEKNLQDVEDSFKDSGIKFLGLRFSFLDEKVRTFVLND